jgi:hypothetical protein
MDMFASQLLLLLAPARNGSHIGTAKLFRTGYGADAGPSRGEEIRASFCPFVCRKRRAHNWSGIQSIQRCVLDFRFKVSRIVASDERSNTHSVAQVK